MFLGQLVQGFRGIVEVLIDITDDLFFTCLTVRKRSLITVHISERETHREEGTELPSALHHLAMKIPDPGRVSPWTKELIRHPGVTEELHGSGGVHGTHGNRA